MTGTGKFLQRQAPAEGATCKGCRGASGFEATVEGELDTRWCQACVDLAIDTHPAAAGATPFDFVAEDDGEP